MQETTKLTNGFLVLRPGEAVNAGTSPSGYRWHLVNQTKRPFRLRLGTRMALGPEEWIVSSLDGRAALVWDAILPD